jgi:ankyrin repeat protein
MHRRFMLLVGMGTALLAGHACRATPGSPLTAAAARNDADAIRRRIADGDRADDGAGGWTALVWAAREDGVDALAALLDAGADVNRRDATRVAWTPLQHAIHRQRIAAVRLLLERGADPNANAGPGTLTPLLMAAGDRDPTIVSLLLAHGGDPHIAGEYGDTPFARAVSGGAFTDPTDRPLFGGCHPATVRVLLEHDPALRLPDNFAGRQALWWARFHGCDEVLALIDSATVAHRDRARYRQ